MNFTPAIYTIKWFTLRMREFDENCFLIDWISLKINHRPACDGLCTTFNVPRTITSVLQSHSCCSHLIDVSNTIFNTPTRSFFLCFIFGIFKVDAIQSTQIKKFVFVLATKAAICSQTSVWIHWIFNERKWQCFFFYFVSSIDIVIFNTHSSIWNRLQFNDLFTN